MAQATGRRIARYEQLRHGATGHGTVRRYATTIRRLVVKTPTICAVARTSVQGKRSADFHQHGLTMLLFRPLPIAVRLACIAIGLMGLLSADLLSAQAAARDTLFDFLIGDWRVEVSPRVSRLAALVHGAPRYRGTWRGQRTDRGVSDELRVADDAGSTKYLLRFDREHDAVMRRWQVRETNRDGAVSPPMTAGMASGLLTLTAPDRRTRSRFSERTATRFRYVREVSTDGGRTWEEPVLVVTAERVAKGGSSAPR